MREYLTNGSWFDAAKADVWHAAATPTATAADRLCIHTSGGVVACESLYRTRRGIWVLYYISRDGKEVFEPVTSQDAQEWLVRHGATDAK